MDERNTLMKTIVAEYHKRWSIELLTKGEKPYLGLADYRVLRYQAVVRHLDRVDVAYACLTHVGLPAQREQGQRDNAKRVLHPERVSQLKERRSRIICQEAVENVVKHCSYKKANIGHLEKLLVA